jgi:cobalt-zinc-cadmium efflux system membrane fusion protein
VATVVAPIAGTVIDRQVGPGQYIQSGAANPVYTVGDLSTVWLVASLREADASTIRVGDTAEVRVLALPGKVFRARITYVAPQVDPASRRIAVRAEVANPARELKPEMFATFALVNAETARRSPAVPSSGVVFEGEEARVWVAGGGGRIELRRVRTGRTESGLVEVVEGLKPGERVVTSGTLFIDREVKRVAG